MSGSFTTMSIKKKETAKNLAMSLKKSGKTLEYTKGVNLVQFSYVEPDEHSESELSQMEGLENGYYLYIERLSNESMPEYKTFSNSDEGLDKATTCLYKDRKFINRGSFIND